MRKKYKLKENYIVVILFMIFFLFQFIQIFQFKFFVQSDDFGYIANSAFFAGYNWNPYTGDMTPYYNIGFSIFSAFAFRIFHSATAIYQCLLFTILVWQLILMYFVYRISYEFFKLDKKISAVIAILYSIGTMSPQTGLYIDFIFFAKGKRRKWEKAKNIFCFGSRCHCSKLCSAYKIFNYCRNCFGSRFFISSYL